MLTKGSTAIDLSSAGRRGFWRGLRRGSRLAPHNLEDQESGGEQSDGDNHRGELPGAPLRDDLVRRDVLGPFHSFRRHFESPCDDERDRKTKQSNHDHCCCNAIGQMQRRHDRCRDLHHQPSDDRIGDRDLVHIAPLQLGEEIAWVQNLFCSGGVCSNGQWLQIRELPTRLSGTDPYDLRIGSRHSSATASDQRNRPQKAAQAAKRCGISS